MTEDRFRLPKGFTLIEVLIAIAIVSLLILISIPAIQASRESARRAQCTNNQKQFGTAFLNFESSKKAFPSSFTLRIQGPLQIDPELELYNYIVDLLPFLEESTISAQYHRNAMFFAAENASAIATPLKVATCPSAPRADIATSTNNYVPSTKVSASVRAFYGKVYAILDKKYSAMFTGGITDYAIPIQAEDGLATRFGYDVPVNAPGGLPSMFPSPVHQKDTRQKWDAVMSSSGSSTFSVQTRAMQITDGLSHTFMMTEVAGRPEHWQMGAHIEKGEPLSSSWADPYGATFDIKGFITEDRYCIIQCDNDGEIYSFHPGGVNFLFADGHVTFVSPETDPRVILAQMTPDKGD